jgi:formate dehydrogenase accessory protein FdhD
MSESHPPAPPLDAVEESPVWLELNGVPVVTWMCTPDALDELVVGWLFGEGYIETPADIVRMRPCTRELGFWVDIDPARVATVEGMSRRRILASGCGSVTAFLGSLADVPRRKGTVPAVDTPALRAVFKELFALGRATRKRGAFTPPRSPTGSRSSTTPKTSGDTMRSTRSSGRRCRRGVRRPT